ETPMSGHWPQRPRRWVIKNTQRPDRAAPIRADECPFTRPAACTPIKPHLLEREGSVGRTVPPPAGEPCVAVAIAVVDEDSAARLQRAGHAAQNVEVRAWREVAERGVQVEHGVEFALIGQLA